MKHEFLMVAGVGLVLWWFAKRAPAAAGASVPLVEIQALKTGVGQGLTSEQEVGLFDRLYGIRSAGEELVKLKTVSVDHRIKICHSDGTCELTRRGAPVVGQSASPLLAPKYFLDYLNVGF